MELCYWHHSMEDDGWLTGCDRIFFISGPRQDCSHCGNFVVLDPTGEYVKKQVIQTKEIVLEHVV